MEKLVFHVAPYKNKKIVQFQIYTTLSFTFSNSKPHIMGIISELRIPDINGEYSYDTKQIYMTNELFNHLYYEVDYLTFNKFIKLP